MITRVFPCALGLGLLALTACMSPGPAVADQGPTGGVPVGMDLGPSTRIPAAMTLAATGAMPMPGEGHGHHLSRGDSSKVELVHEGHNDAHAVGTVKAVDPAQHKLTVSHEPISELGWPAMTMEFSVAPSVNLGAIKPGSRVNFRIEKGKGGMYEIQSVQPAGARR